MKLPSRSLLKDSSEISLYEWDVKEMYNPNPRSGLRFNYESRFRARMDSVTRKLSYGRILDVGCAQANYAISLATEGFLSVGLDLRPPFIKYAKRKVEEKEERNIDFVVASAEHLPFRAECFEAVILGELLEHLAKPEKSLEEAKRVLKREYYLFVSTPNGKRLSLNKTITYKDTRNVSVDELKKRQFGADTHVSEFTKEELATLFLSSGFKPIEFKYTCFSNVICFILCILPFPIRILRKIENILLNTSLIAEKLAASMMFTCIKSVR